MEDILILLWIGFLLFNLLALPTGLLIFLVYRLSRSRTRYGSASWRRHHRRQPGELP